MEKKQSAEQVLQSYLRDGEQVRWQGKTENFPLLDNDAKWQILGKWIGTVVAACAILMLYIGGNENWSVKAAGVIVLIAALLVVSPIMERYNVLRQSYWITDQRAILMTRDRSFYSMELSQIDDFRLVKGKGSRDCLVLGSCIFEDVNRQLRWRSCHPKADMQGNGKADEAQGLVVFGVSNGESAAAILRQYKANTAA